MARNGVTRNDAMCPPHPTPPQGLPPQWESLLKSSGISRAQVSAHPQEVLDVLQFHMEGPPPKVPCTPHRNV